jgi:hypothetical protein
MTSRFAHAHGIVATLVGLSRFLCVLAAALPCACGGSPGYRPQLQTPGLFITGLSSPAALALSPSDIYCLDLISGIGKIPIAGGTATQLTDSGCPQGIAADSTAVYWTETCLVAGTGIMRSVKK